MCLAVERHRPPGFLDPQADSSVVSPAIRGNLIVVIQISAADAVASPLKSQNFFSVPIIDSMHHSSKRLSKLEQ